MNIIRSLKDCQVRFRPYENFYLKQFHSVIFISNLYGDPGDPKWWKIYEIEIIKSRKLNGKRWGRKLMKVMNKWCKFYLKWRFIFKRNSRLKLRQVVYFIKRVHQFFIKFLNFCHRNVIFRHPADRSATRTTPIVITFWFCQFFYATFRLKIDGFIIRPPLRPLLPRRYVAAFLTS